jgi:hypothetical protein
MQIYTLTPRQRQLIAAQDLPSRLPFNSFAIYTLTDPSNRLTRYVGMTNAPRYRLVLHLKRIPFVGAKSVWLRSLHASELVPTMTLIETVRGEQAAAKHEAKWIRRLLEERMPLVNKEARELERGTGEPPDEQVDGVTQQAAEDPARQELMQFFGHPVLKVWLADGRTGLYLRHLCEALRVDNNGQFQRIVRDEVLSEHYPSVRIDTRGGPQVVNILLEAAVPFWLLGIDVRRIAPEIRARIVEYQRAALLRLAASEDVRQSWQMGGEA